MVARSLAALGALALAGCGGGGERASEPGFATPQAGGAATGVRLERIGRFESPLYVTAPRKDRRRVFVVEQAGRIMIVRDGRKLARPFLDIRSLVKSGGEQGLLSVAFPRDYAKSRRFFVYYTDREARQRIVEYRAAGANRADPGSARLVLEMADSESNHNGGLLQFGPDGLLYVGTGDGGGAGDRHGTRGNAQDLSSLLGKILRLDVRRRGAYRIPAMNPFTGRPGARGEIYAYGLRNPWRFSFDRVTGDLAIGDVGQSEIEEIDFVRAGDGRGANFGWRVFEGRRRYAEGESAPGAIAPVIETRHADGNCSITGGVVVRDRRLRGLYGRYVFGDFCKGLILSAKLQRPRAIRQRSTGLKVPNLSSFGEDARGRVYAVSLNGPVYRLVPK